MCDKSIELEHRGNQWKHYSCVDLNIINHISLHRAQWKDNIHVVELKKFRKIWPSDHNDECDPFMHFAHKHSCVLTCHGSTRYNTFIIYV